MSPQEFLAALMLYCKVTGASVSSYGRTHDHNVAVGGVYHSGHLTWLAADVTYDAPCPEIEAKRWGERLGLLVIHEADHDHLQPLSWLPG